MTRRKTPLKSNPEKVREWQERSRAKQRAKLKFHGGTKKIKTRSTKRRSQETEYGILRGYFLAIHPICPVTGQQTTEIHHSAKREGGWLNCTRYWIAVSALGHKWIEENKKEAESYGLMVRISESYGEHLVNLYEENIPLTKIAFYEKWNG